jgi:NADH-quinone oxidoreductase subunit M
VLGLGGAWGPVLSLLGVLSTYAPLAVVAAIALVIIAAAHLAAVSRVAFGPLDPAWEKSDLLEPFGGKFPDLTTREWTSVGPLVLLVVLLGLWPAPIISASTGTVRDLANAVSPPGPDQVALR